MATYSIELRSKPHALGGWHTRMAAVFASALTTRLATHLRLDGRRRLSTGSHAIDHGSLSYAAPRYQWSRDCCPWRVV